MFLAVPTLSQVGKKTKVPKGVSTLSPSILMNTIKYISILCQFILVLTLDPATGHTTSGVSWPPSGALQL